MKRKYKTFYERPLSIKLPFSIEFLIDLLLSLLPYGVFVRNQDLNHCILFIKGDRPTTSDISKGIVPCEKRTFFAVPYLLNCFGLLLPLYTLVDNISSDP